jgi:3-mercaptopyruvate sulfurtransferase SseA
VAGLERELVLVCADGYQSSLALVSLEQLGFFGVGDLVGGFSAWVDAGLPTKPASPREDGLTGIGGAVPSRPRSHDRPE